MRRYARRPSGRTAWTVNIVSLTAPLDGRRDNPGPSPRQLAGRQRSCCPPSPLPMFARNARRTPHGEAAIEALAASIAVKGILQNLVVEPEVIDGNATGFYFVTIGDRKSERQKYSH